jgi:hypothetical protein
VAAQRVMSIYFHHTLKYQWVDAIAKKMSLYISEEFQFDIGSQIKEENIDPCLRRLLVMIKQFMQTVIFECFENALRDYLIFLLGFVLRDDALRVCRIVDEVRFDPWVQLKLSRADPEAILINDVELIPRRPGPMIKVYAVIEDVAIRNSAQKRQKIVTSPTLPQINKDLFQVIQTMHEALQDVDRVDSLVFPLLQLWSKSLQVPDV